MLCSGSAAVRHSGLVATCPRLCCPDPALADPPTPLDTGGAAALQHGGVVVRALAGPLAAAALRGVAPPAHGPDPVPSDYPPAALPSKACQCWAGGREGVQEC
jgi:hypothetical protein